MNDINSEILSVLKSLDSRMSTMETKMTSMENRMSNMEKDISKIKKDAEITRVAANYNGEKLDELSMELKKLNILA